MNEKINQVRSCILSEILPLLRNIKQEMKESSSHRIPAQSLPLSPESPVKNHTVEEEAKEGIGENQMAEWEQVIDEEEKMMLLRKILLRRKAMIS